MLNVVIPKIPSAVDELMSSLNTVGSSLATGVATSPEAVSFAGSMTVCVRQPKEAIASMPTS